MVLRGSAKRSRSGYVAVFGAFPHGGRRSERSRSARTARAGGSPPRRRAPGPPPRRIRPDPALPWLTDRQLSEGYPWDV